MNWRTDPARDVPPWRQVVEAALDAVASGALESGDKLPSVRRMAAQALVNHNTAARAYRELEVLGIVKGESGRGVFVTEDGPRLAREERRAATVAALRRAFEEALRAGHEAEFLLALLRKELRRTA